jgi:hypothetical protein
MSDAPQIDGWQQMTLVFAAEACAILRYSHETIRQMCRAGVLRQVGTRITVLSILDLLEGKTTWPVKERLDAKSTKAPITTTKKQSSTNGRSATAAKRTGSKTATKKRRAFDLPK